MHPVDETQQILFDTPVQNKHPGPNTVHPTSAGAYSEQGTQKKISGGIFVARNLVRKFPDKTAYELLQLSQTFTDIYDLRRYLSALKNNHAEVYNPSERECTVVKRKTFTWRLV